MKLQDQRRNMEQLLESAAIVSWTDLMPDGPQSLLHVEYQLTQAGTLDYLQVWSSVKWGYWLLVCTYWMSASASHKSGIHFDNGYKSQRLTDCFELLMENQNLFVVSGNRDCSGLVQIKMPTDRETQAATASITECVGRVESLTTAKLFVDGIRKVS